MTETVDGHQHLEALPSALLKQPLDYILADHHRQRLLCVLCDRIADDGCSDRKTVSEIIDYITNDMAVHVIDEEQDLFPLLRRRADPEDDIEEVLDKLSGEHAHDEALAEMIVSELGRALKASPQDLPAKLVEALKQFSHNQKRHLALENAMILPLAKVRLTKKDLEELSARMAARRGVR